MEIKEHENQSAKASPHSWILVAAVFWTNTWVISYRSISVTFVGLLDEYNMTRQEAAWCTISAVIGLSFGGLVTGCISQYFTVRKLTISTVVIAGLCVSLCSCASGLAFFVVFYGIIQGFAIGIYYSSTLHMINHAFPHNRAAANGLSMAGNAFGTMIHPPLLQLALDEYGIRGTFLLLGGFIFQGLLGTAFLRVPMNPPLEIHGNKKEISLAVIDAESTIGKQNSSEEDKVATKGILKRSRCPFILETKILTNLDFIFLSLFGVILSGMAGIYLTIIVDFARDRRVPPQEGVYLSTTFGIGDLAGRFIFGWITDKIPWKKRTTFSGLAVLVTVSFSIFPLCQTYTQFLFVSIIAGMLNGGTMININPMLVEYVKTKSASLIGYSISIIGITGFSRILLIGYFRDQRRSYDFLFVTLGLALLVTVFMWLIKFMIQNLIARRATHR